MSNVRTKLGGAVPVTLIALTLAACSGPVMTRDEMASAQPQPDTPALVSPAKGAGMVVIRSNRSVEDTVARLRAAIAAKGLKVVATIDHAANAKDAGLSLRPTTLVLFGNPALGTPLMNDRQTLGLDLPQRVLVYTDEAGKTWIAYNDPAWLAERHGVVGHDADLARIAAALSGFVHQAAD